MSTKLQKLLAPFILSLGLVMAVTVGGCSSSTTTPEDAGKDSSTKDGGKDAAAGTGGSDAAVDMATDAATDTEKDAATDGADAADAAGEGG